MTVLTIYFCGTSSTKFDDTHPDYWQGELIARLASSTLGREFAEWIVIDGPGSGDLQADDLWTEFTSYPLTGVLWGNGWEENVKHAMNMIKGKFDWQRTKLTEQQYTTLKNANIPIEDVKISGTFFNRTYDYGDRLVTQQQLQAQIVNIFRKGALPSKVNLVGWSRGGISCHMLANAMFNDSELEKIPVNIFTVDPVPGSGNFQNERVTLKSNVKEYVGFYARDERSFGFDCVIPVTEPATTISVFPMPGRHATLVGNASLDGKSAGTTLKEPGLVVRHFAERCLTAWGTKLDKQLKLSAGQLLEYADAIAKSDADYLSMRSHVYTTSTSTDGERSVSLGDKGKAYSAISGEPFSPSSGLSSNWFETYSALVAYDQDKHYWTKLLQPESQALHFTGVVVKPGDTFSVTAKGEIAARPDQNVKSTLESDRLRVYVGYLEATLPAPEINPKLNKNILNPALSTFELGAEIIIPEINGFSMPYTVTLVWTTSAGGHFEDVQIVDTATPLSEFLIPRAELELNDKTSIDVQVYYTVSKDGRRVRPRPI